MWVITPSWLSGSWRSFLYSSSVYSCHLFIVSSASVRAIPFLSFIVPVFAWNIPLVSNFLEEISTISHSVVFLYFFALIAEEGFLISPSILWNSTFRWVYRSFPPLPLASLLFSAICKASSDNHFACLHFFFLRMVLITASCRELWTSFYNSSGTHSIRSNPLSLFVTSTV